MPSTRIERTMPNAFCQIVMMISIMLFSILWCAIIIPFQMNYDRPFYITPFVDFSFDYYMLSPSFFWDDDVYFF